MSIVFVQICRLQTELLPRKIVVTILDGTTIASTCVVKKCPVVVESRTLKANLLVFGQMEFDLILGMN